MNAQLSMFDLMNCADSASAISSPEAASGASPPASPDGQTIILSGPARARASRSASLEKDLGPPTIGTCGRTFTGSLPPADQRSALANRLVERLATLGSTEFDLIWKVKTTPAKHSIFRLAPSTRRTSDSGSIGWPTPRVGETPDRTSRPGYFQGLSNVARDACAWATPKASDGEGGRTTKTEGGGNAHLPIQARESASWPTPTSRDGKDGSYTPNVPLNGLLGRMVWATPRASPNENRTTKITPSQEAGKHGMYLAVQAIGTTQNSASAQTEKRGALNPEFVFWLQGFPTAWVVCALLSAKRGKGL